ncbi:hypothetical protein NHX12_015107 [Muraenolepis orangiensis]|uniref:type I protein arginine methyltransferase n=1 Tax=Muraenolepis orangiensis TaxID=630683 RepID=A0A9Q0DDE0_9TELE|nr:hypothetical protein NHX12_015107 [Muraenolepis orangiensis]
MAPGREETKPVAFPIRGEQKEEAPGAHPQVKVCRHRGDRDLTLLLLPTAGARDAPRLRVQDGDGVSVLDLSFSGETDGCRVGSQSLLLTHDQRSVLLLCQTQADLQNICQLLWRPDGSDGEQTDTKRGEKRHQDGRRLALARHTSAGETRTGLSRTATYQRAFLGDEADFRDKEVLSVGGGSGILSFFAVQAGAKKVYAVETNPMAQYLKGAMEEVELPHMVDVIVSEPIGYMLLHERKLDSFLYARKWLKPNGLMFPSSGDIHFAPFTDDQQQKGFYGINLCGLHPAALNEVLRQPIVDTFDMQTSHQLPGGGATGAAQSGLVHGLAFWFDIAFSGSTSTVWFSTAPTEPLTHWYQVRCLLQTPLFAKLGQTLSGTVLMTTNKRSGNILDLKNPFFRMPTWLHD